MSRDEIITYFDMCQRERMSLQRGMNFFESPATSIVLMSRRRNAPYEDEMSDDGMELIYEGHDVPKVGKRDPKTVHQPWKTTGGSLTENGKFANAVDSGRLALVRVYEKLQPGIWSDKGLFRLASYDYRSVRRRKVFKFHMRLTEDEGDIGDRLSHEHRRLIPGWVKQEVYKRDGGKCVLCGASDNLHFDHDLPYSRGGASINPENVRILCERHNLEKGAKIQ